MAGLGNITVDFTVWCSRCYEWNTSSESRKSKARKQWRSQGWTQIGKEKLWICPDCSKPALNRKVYA